jgi:hypothetical protein
VCAGRDDLRIKLVNFLRNLWSATARYFPDLGQTVLLVPRINPLGTVAAKKMLIEFIKVLNTADETIGHNGDKFDLAWVRTRCLFHGIDMFPSYTTIDTLKVARSKFKFNSNI